MLLLSACRCSHACLACLAVSNLTLLRHNDEELTVVTAAWLAPKSLLEIRLFQAMEINLWIPFSWILRSCIARRS